MVSLASRVISNGVKDWFFHSNVVELLELRSYRTKETETGDLLELAGVVANSMRPVSSPATKPRKAKREELEQLYMRLEVQLSKYRYP